MGVGKIFVGIDLDVECRHGIAAALAGVPIVGVRSSPDLWHITLRFLGDVSELQYDRLLFELANTTDVEPFRLSFAGIGAFPHASSATVLWLGLNQGSHEVRELFDQVDEACEHAGFGREDRPFVPHLTLSRIRPPLDVWAALEAEPVPAVRLTVDHLTVFRSDRSEERVSYSVLDRVTLQKSS